MFAERETTSYCLQILALVPPDHGLRPLLNDSRINMVAFRRVCRAGLHKLPPRLRFHCWKLLLGSLTGDVLGWAGEHASQLKHYREAISSVEFVGESLLGEECTVDRKVWQQIEMDTTRTHNVRPFFGEPAKGTGLVVNGRQAVHHQVMSRILYVWARMNPKVGYVQGMNELLAPLYFLGCGERAGVGEESECFFAFSALMSEFINLFIESMDRAREGIHGRIALFSEMLKVIDYNIWRKLREEKLELATFCFRWFTLLLSQEFALEDTLRLWDVLFSYQEEKRELFLFNLCVAILLLKRELILTSDFTVFLPELHKMKNVRVEDLLQAASCAYSTYHKMDFGKLARMIAEEEAKSKGKTLLVSKGSQMYYLLEKTKKLLTDIKNKITV